MTKTDLLSRLRDADTGWPEWAKLISKVQRLSFTFITDQYLGDCLSAGTTLTFAVPTLRWPKWMPPYVSALYGLKADEYEMAGGFAQAFTGSRTTRGAVFAGAGNDDALGYPLIKVPRGVYPFQSSESGALFHINKSLEVLYPDADKESLRVLDPLERFTRKTIREVLERRSWLAAYPRLDNIID